jgi:hypothetical protein
VERRITMHLDNGQLRAFLDGEAGENETRHLAACPECRQRLETVKARAGTASQRLSFLASQPGDQAAPSSSFALSRFKARLRQEKEIPVMNKLFSARFRSLWVGLAVVVVLAATLAVPQARAWAGQFLGLFRVQQVTVLPIDTSGLTALTGNSVLGKQIGDLLSSSVTVTQKPGDPQTAASAAQAGQMAGFNVRLPSSQTSIPVLTVQSGMAFQFVIDRQRAQALLDEAGRSDLVLPASLDGATVKVTIPGGVSAAYGDCPAADSSSVGLGLNASGSTGRQYPNCVILAEIPSPTVLTPPDVDLSQLAELALQFTGMNAAEAHAFSQTMDWTSSLVIPIPKNAATYQQVTVDGVTGTLIMRPPDDAPQYALIWVKNGIIYAIGGLGTDTTTAINMANSLN